MNNDYVIIGNFGGYYDANGDFIVCHEYGLTDADTDRFASEVMNGYGYYDDNGKYRSYNIYD